MHNDARNRRRAASLLSIGIAALGAAILVGLFLFGDAPDPWWLWGGFALVFVVLEFAAVEVNDRLLVSSSVMVAFSAAVVFGRSAAVPAVALIAGVAFLQPADLQRRRWRQPLANFGQLVVSATCGTMVFALFLPSGDLRPSDLPAVVAGAALGATVYDWVNFQLVALGVRLVYPERQLQPWLQMIPNHLALVAMGVLGGLLGSAYLLVGTIIVPLILVAFLVGHTGFATYARLREAHESTLRGFVKVIEALDAHTKGHTDRVVHFCRIAGEQLGLSADRQQRLRWAALIHELGALAVPGHLAAGDDSLDPIRRRQVFRHQRVVDGILAEVDFLQPMVEITAEMRRVLLRDRETGDLMPEARILAAAHVFDALTSARSYRAAVTQTEAFARLRSQLAAFGGDVVEALIGAIERRREVYGSPDEQSSAEVERLVKERAIRA